MTEVDVGVAVFVLISAILATARGFTREVLSLATWAGSAAFAAYMYFYHPDIARPYFSQDLLAIGVTVIGSFLVALIVLHLLTMWIGDLIVDSRMGPLDRTLGFAFGAARGVVICVVAAVFANFLFGGEAMWPPVKNAKSYPPLLNAGDYLIEILPDDAESQLRGFLENRGGDAEPADAPDTGTGTSPAEPAASGA